MIEKPLYSWRILLILIVVAGSAITSWMFFKDFYVSIVLAYCALPIIIRAIKWPLELWFSIERLKENRDSYLSTSVELIGTAVSSTKISTEIKEITKPREVESFFTYKVIEKETQGYIVDLNNSLTAQIFIPILVGAATIILGFYNLTMATDATKIDTVKLVLPLIPLSWQLGTLVAPILHYKKRNEKVLV